jgi:hypothetical protein
LPRTRSRGGLPIAGRERLILWEGLNSKRWEVADIHLTRDGVEAHGTQIGVEPLAYRLDYRLDASHGFVTTVMDVHVAGEGWRRSLCLDHDGHGSWKAKVTSEGAPSLPPATGSTDGLEEARDCDLGFSPMTNLLPVRRHELIERVGGVEIVTAWISVPELVLQPYRQRYDHLRATEHGAIVRFLDLGLSHGFRADLELDRDGIVEVYPQLARRVHSRACTTARKERCNVSQYQEPRQS